MSISLNAKAYSSTANKEFQKHFNAVKFCIENELSFPKETSLFFKGKVAGDDLEDFKPDCIMQYIENGVQVPLKQTTNNSGTELTIKVSDISLGVDLIIVSI